MLIIQLKGCRNIRRLCGWELPGQAPSSPTFSRAFSEFATGELPQKVHEAMVEKHCGQKLAGRISRDATAIEACEKPVKKEKSEEAPESRRESERFTVYLQCRDKKNSKGCKETWIGYKLHLDCIDGDIPISAILSSAALHDSRVAIPLAQMSSERVANLYDLMDAAYDSPEIHVFSRSSGHRPIIDIL